MEKRTSVRDKAATITTMRHEMQMAIAAAATVRDVTVGCAGTCSGSTMEHACIRVQEINQSVNFVCLLVIKKHGVRRIWSIAFSCENCLTESSKKRPAREHLAQSENRLPWQHEQHEQVIRWHACIDALFRTKTDQDIVYFILPSHDQ
jgi:hypothetical protein